MVVTASGNCARASAAWEMPTPSAAESPTIVVFRAVSPSAAMSFMPVMAMVENTAAVAPPSTHCGMVVSTAENFGMIPASSKNAPVSAKTLRFTTLFVATIPTFWEYVAVGRQPSNAVRMLLTP